MKKAKLCLVCSSGGHLMQMMALAPWWSLYERFWVTFKKEDSCSVLIDEKTYFAYFPTNRNFVNLIRNTILAVSLLIKERPTIIFSSGAGVAVPFFYLGKIFGAKLVYMEVYDRIDSPTLTGRLVYPICDKFLVQWSEQMKFYPKAEFWGQTL